MDPSSYSVGNRVYRGVSSAPNIGPVTNTQGYAERDRLYRTRMKNKALRKYLKAKKNNQYMSSEFLNRQNQGKVD